jgi:hypothetical protein
MRKKGTRKNGPSRAGGNHFPRKTNPNRKASAAASSSSSDGRYYSAKCDPTGPRAALNDEQRAMAAQYLPMAQALVNGWRNLQSLLAGG